MNEQTLKRKKKSLGFILAGLILFIQEPVEIVWKVEVTSSCASDWMTTSACQSESSRIPIGTEVENQNTFSAFWIYLFLLNGIKER